MLLPFSRCTVPSFVATEVPIKNGRSLFSLQSSLFSADLGPNSPLPRPSVLGLVIALVYIITYLHNIHFLGLHLD